MCPRPVLIGALLACLAGVVSADTITYGVTVNTSSISGTAGSLDFQFNPGPLVTQAASLQILSFASNGSLAGSPSLTGDVTGGPMPATLAFDNGTRVNDYFPGGFAGFFELREQREPGGFPVAHWRCHRRAYAGHSGVRQRHRVQRLLRRVDVWFYSFIQR